MASSKSVKKLETKLKSYRTAPVPKEKALANLERLKAEVGMKDVRSNSNDIDIILRKAGPLSDEILDLRKKERT